MDRCNNLRALTHRRGDTFHRTGAHIADGEDAGAVRLERKAAWRCEGLGANEILAVAFNVRQGKPVGVRCGAYQKEEMVNIAR